MHVVPKIALDHSTMSSFCKLQPKHSHLNSMISTIMQVLFDRSLSILASWSNLSLGPLL